MTRTVKTGWGTVIPFKEVGASGHSQRADEHVDGVEAAGLGGDQQWSSPQVELLQSHDVSLDAEAAPGLQARSPTAYGV